ncbi:preprotein translocase subunit SecY [Ponticaulis profundi]|uniref:Protein translocase subunit SecY n=1 Tax=Ponticaulis profundi TaxID=2665222 RepID=A0ABW1SFE1_9PROT
MASASEQLARNMNFEAFGKAKELQQRILFTLGILIVYRLGTYLPIPGIDPEAFRQLFQSQQNGILGNLNLFAGGAVERMAVFALNVMPYISASIIMQLMTTASPTLERLKKEGETGRQQINQYTRYLTVLFALVQSFGIAQGLSGSRIEGMPVWYFDLTTVVTLTGGTLLLMWMGEQITSRGIGNGISLIIFAGIVAELPRAIFNLISGSWQGATSVPFVFGILAMAIAIIVFIVFMERSQRRLLIKYPKRQQGNKMSQDQTSFLPLKLNTSGVIPPIFASSLLLLPATVANFMAGQDGAASGILGTITSFLGAGQPGFIILYAVLIVFFCFFYTSIVFNPEETADNLRKYGGFVPGIRPGKRTAEYLDYVLSRLTVIGAAYLTFVCLMPEILRAQMPSIPFYLGGTSLLIVVSVTMDTVTQIQSHLVAHQYEGMIKKSRLGGKKR